MHTSTLMPKDWAEAEFGGTELGDLRRSRRLVQIAQALGQRPSGTLPSAMLDWASLKAAYRMLNHKAITPEQLLARHQQQTRRRTATGGPCLLIEDTTSLDYSFHSATTGLGRIGDNGGQGIYVHSTLAIRLGEAEVLGLFAQHAWMRPPRTDGRSRKTESSTQMRKRSRESQRWAACLVGLVLPEGQYTFVADREADIYEVFERCAAAHVGMLIRLRGDRALQGEERNVLEAMQQAPLRGRITIALRSRPEQAAREVRLEVRSGELTLRPPAHQPAGSKSLPLRAKVLILQEVNAPVGVEPIRWVLLTTWPVASLKQCLSVAQAYAMRWLIEEYHKCLKSGCSVEKSQLEQGQSLLRLLAILAVVAVRLLDAKLLARRDPQGRRLQKELPPAMLAVLQSRYPKPQGGWTNQQVMRHIAKMGGFLARTGDGEPGWLTIWRGFRELQLLAEGYRIGNKCG